MTYIEQLKQIANDPNMPAMTRWKAEVRLQILTGQINEHSVGLAEERTHGLGGDLERIIYMSAGLVTLAIVTFGLCAYLFA